MAQDPRLPELLDFTVHELRSPLTPLMGYLGLLQKGVAGPLGEQQRRLVDEAAKCCGRFSEVVTEIDELGKLEAGRIAYNRAPLDLAVVLSEVIANLPELPDRTVGIEFSPSGTLAVQGDAVRLKSAFASVLHALRRELAGSDRLAVRLADGRLTIAEPARLDELHQLPTERLRPFNEFRGGTGLRLPNARRILASHGATLWSPDDESKASAIITFGSAPTS